MSSDDSKKIIELDSKTQALFKKRNYLIDKKISEGAFGEIYKGVLNSVEKGPIEIAVKVMNLKIVGKKFREKFLPREISALTKVQHPKCIFIFEILRANNKIYIFMEFANGGDLTTAIEKKGALPEQLAAFWFTHSSEALAFIHREHKIAHRDIKGDNILIHRGIAKLTDFGFAKYSWNEKTDQPVMADTYCGTEPYHSPQLVQRGVYNPFSADCWAMGVVLFVMLNGKFPYLFEDSDKQLLQMNDPYFLGTRYVCKQTKDLRHLQECLFQIDEKRRMTMQEVIKHPWLRRRRKKARKSEVISNSSRR